MQVALFAAASQANTALEIKMKTFIARIAMTMGVAALTPVAAMAKETGGYTIQEVCTNPALAPLSQKLWDYVATQNKLEVYIAYLEACGDSPLTAEFATLARDVVIRQTANYANVPTDKYVFSKISDRRVNAYYVG